MMMKKIRLALFTFLAISLAALYWTYQLASAIPQNSIVSPLELSNAYLPLTFNMVVITYLLLVLMLTMDPATEKDNIKELNQIKT